MKLPRFMPALCVLPVALAIFAASNRTALAAGNPDDYAEKPIAVISLPSYEALLKDSAFIGKLVDRPALPQMMEGFISFFTGGKGLVGLDKTRPMGVLLRMRELGEPEPLGFIPVENLKELISAFEGVTGGPLEPDDDGIYTIETPTRLIYMQEKDGWAYLTRKVEDLNAVPADPVALLDGIDKQYGMAVRVFVRNIPDMQREAAIEQLREGMKAGMKRLPEEADEEFETRRKIAENSLKGMERLVNETDHVTLGWKLDHESGASYLDLSVIAQPGTDLAKQTAQLAAGAKSAFTGFLLQDAAMTMNLAVTLTNPEEIGRATAAVDALEVKAMQAIEKDKKIKSEEKRDEVKAVVADLIGVLRATAEKGRFDGGAVVKLEPGAMTVAMGGNVADDAKLEAALKKLNDLAQEHSEFAGVNWDADKHGDVRFHTFQTPVKDDKAKDVLGDPLEVALGLGPQTFYLAFGRDPIATLKEVIDGSKSGGEKKVPPAQGLVSLRRVMNFAAAQNDDAGAAAAAKVLENAGEQDHLRFSAEAVPGGMRYRLELEKGALEAIGKAAAAQSGGMRRGL